MGAEGELRELLVAGLEEIGLDADPKQVVLLLRYQAEIEMWNPRVGLVAASGRELLVRHILDSLAALPHLRAGRGARFADLGSGAGLPGIPLACVLPDVHFTLVERSGRRCGFLQNAALTLGLQLRVIERDLTKLNERFDAVLFRALRPLSHELLRQVSAAVKPRGAIYAYKGRRATVMKELEAVGLLQKAEVIALKVPFLDEERHLIRIEATTPD